MSARPIDRCFWVPPLLLALQFSLPVAPLEGSLNGRHFTHRGVPDDENGSSVVAEGKRDLERESNGYQHPALHCD